MARNGETMILFGKVYEYVDGKLTKVEITDADREEFGAVVDEFIKENEES